MTVINRFTCGSDGSRWYGVGSTRSIGSATISAPVPPNGSLYDPSTAPPSCSTRSDISRRRGSFVAQTCCGERPVDPAATFFRRTAFFLTI